MRRRKYVNIIVTVPGWGLTDDQIRRLGSTNQKEIYWFCNGLIPVKAPSMGLSAELLVSEVKYIANADSMGCDIMLVNRYKYCKEDSL
jgi:prophage tail gpP-like protein